MLPMPGGSFISDYFMAYSTGLKELDMSMVSAANGTLISTCFLRGCSGLTTVNRGEIPYQSFQAAHSFEINPTGICKVTVTGDPALWSQWFVSYAAGVTFINAVE
jgi:hypothetical protein